MPCTSAVRARGSTASTWSNAAHVQSVCRDPASGTGTGSTSASQAGRAYRPAPPHRPTEARPPPAHARRRASARTCGSSDPVECSPRWNRTSCRWDRTPVWMVRSTAWLASDQPAVAVAAARMRDFSVGSLAGRQHRGTRPLRRSKRRRSSTVTTVSVSWRPGPRCRQPTGACCAGPAGRQIARACSVNAAAVAIPSL